MASHTTPNSILFEGNVQTQPCQMKNGWRRISDEVYRAQFMAEYQE